MSRWEGFAGKWFKFQQLYWSEKQFVALVQLPFVMLTSSLMIPEAEICLVELLKTKSQAAFAQLYDCYAGALFSFICRATNDTARAEGLLQEVFVRLWQEIDHYDPSKERLFTWTFRITLNMCGQTKETIKALNL